MRDKDFDFTIATLGEGRIPSPMSGVRFTRDDERVLYHSTLEGMNAWLEARRLRRWRRPDRGSGFLRSFQARLRDRDLRRPVPRLERRHPRDRDESAHHYGVRSILGFRFGYEGLVRVMGTNRSSSRPTSCRNPRERRLDPGIVARAAGARGDARVLERLGIGILFAIGGDGTLRGAHSDRRRGARRGRGSP